jgi:MFS family permease
LHAVAQPPHRKVADSSLTALLAVPGFKALFVSTWLWHTTRWCGLFSTSYLITKLADAPFLNQLVGAFVFAPMLIGGMAAGAFSDQIDRRRIVLGTQSTLIPVSVLMFVLVQTDTVRVWMVFPFMFALGLGGLVNLTAQRPLIYETVGPSLAQRALALETVGAAAASIAGSLLAGTMIELIGIEAAFAYLVVALSVSALLLFRVRNIVASQAPRRSMPSVPLHETVQSSMQLLRRSPSLTSLLGVTVVVNLCYFSFVPLVPVMAARFDANAFMAGALGATAGCSQMAVGVFLASRGVARRGHVYVGGSALALSGLGLFAFAPHFGLAFAALLLAGAGQGGFGSMQSVLTIESAGAAERGAAQGLLSTAIGAMPLGMLLLGVTAELLGPRLALLVSSAMGLGLLAAWTTWRPQVFARHLPATAGSTV